MTTEKANYASLIQMAKSKENEDAKRKDIILI